MEIEVKNGGEVKDKLVKEAKYATNLREYVVLRYSDDHLLHDLLKEQIFRILTICALTLDKKLEIKCQDGVVDQADV
jgi:hypothetical protein